MFFRHSLSSLAGASPPASSSQTGEKASRQPAHHFTGDRYILADKAFMALNACGLFGEYHGLFKSAVIKEPEDQLLVFRLISLFVTPNL